MGKKEKKVKSAKSEKILSEEETVKAKPTVSSDDEEANEDLSLRIVQKAMQRASSSAGLESGVTEIVSNMKGKQRSKKSKKKDHEIDAPNGPDSGEIDTSFKSFCGDLFMDDKVKEEKKVEIDKVTEFDDQAAEGNIAAVSNNNVLMKLLRGPRYFDPPDSSWGTCYNCGEEGHATVNCTSAKRRKPCFVCGSLEHNAKQCDKKLDCYICKQQGHRAKSCPERKKSGGLSSKMCLKCGDSGHDMFSCRNDYDADDLKELQCYICKGFGHLCCVKYTDPGSREVSCYRCGQTGHTGLACAGSRGENSHGGSLKSCYKCGEEGHFARECPNSAKAVKRHRELSTPKQRSSKKIKDYSGAKSAPPDLGKTRKKKKIKYESGSELPSKAKRRGGWTSEDPGDTLWGNGIVHNWRSPATPNNRRLKISNSRGDFASSSRSPKKHHKLNFNNSASNGSAKVYQHRYSASRFGYNGNDGRRNYDHW